MKTKRCYCFDLDDTLIKTSAKIRVYRNGVYVKSLTPKEYNFYEQHPDDKLDFKDFLDGEMILNAKKHTIWPVIKNVSNAIKENKSNSEIYVLTARDKTVKSYIYEFLKQNGIKIKLENVITIGDNKGYINIADEKHKILTELKNKYDEIIVFDDNPQTIELAASIPGIKTRLVEAFIEDSDPIKDMGIGVENQIKKWIKDTNFFIPNYLYPASALIYCAGHGKTEWVKYLIDTYPIETFKGTDADQNALPWAAERGHIEIVKMLLDYGFDPSVLDNYALRFSKQNNHTKIVKLLLKDKRVQAEQERLRSKGILEKFTEESDPIQDLNIGIRSFLEKEYEIKGKTSSEAGSIKFFGTNKYKYESFFIYMFLKYLLENKKLSQHNINNAFKCTMNYEFNNKPLKHHIKNINLVKNALKDHYGIIIDEDFIKEDAMGGVNSPIATLANTPGMGNVVPASSTLIGSGDTFGNVINGKPYTQGNNKRKRKSMKKKTRKKVNEKFTKDSDPIKDMNIGITGLWDYTPKEAAIEIWSIMRPKILKRIDASRKWNKRYVVSPLVITKRGCEDLAFEPNEYTLKYLEKLVKKEIEKSVLEYPILADYIDFEIILEDMNEENINTYDQIGMAMAKKMKVKPPFKKKKEKGNQNAMVQRKFEHEIITFDNFKNLLKENK